MTALRACFQRSLLSPYLASTSLKAESSMKAVLVTIIAAAIRLRAVLVVYWAEVIAAARMKAVDSARAPTQTPQQTQPAPALRHTEPSRAWRGVRPVVIALVAPFFLFMAIAIVVGIANLFRPSPSQIANPGPPAWFERQSDPRPEPAPKPLEWSVEKPIWLPTSRPTPTLLLPTNRPNPKLLESPLPAEGPPASSPVTEGYEEGD